MEITFEQAKAFEAVVRRGTIQKAAQELNKAHSAVLYSLKSMEELLNLTLFNRSGYRNKITNEGEIVLKYCKQMLSLRRELGEVCVKIKNGWEPSLKFVYDGVVDFNTIGDALYILNEMKAPTEVKVLAAHLGEVESLFNEEDAHLMVTILPLQKLQIPSFELKPIRMHLVAHSHHPLGQKHRTKLGQSQLNRHTYVKIKTAHGQVGLGTEQMMFDSYFYVNDFNTKKSAINKCLGFGWLPDYLTEKELSKGSLCLLNTEIDNTHTVYPRLYYRNEKNAGKAVTELLKFFKDATECQN